MTGALCILAAGDEAEAASARAVRRALAGRPVRGRRPSAPRGRFRRPDRRPRSNGPRAAPRSFAACAIGEIGLDYHYDFSPRDVQQRRCSRRSSRWRVELDLPVVIHTREATTTRSRSCARPATGVRGVFHCFTGDAAMARRALDLGFLPLVRRDRHVSEGRRDLRDAARIVPADRLLVETDSPFLAPVPHRGKRNEPAYVARVAGGARRAFAATPRAALDRAGRRAISSGSLDGSAVIQLATRQRLSALTPCEDSPVL